jgi:predicted secreted protein
MFHRPLFLLAFGIILSCCLPVRADIKYSFNFLGFSVDGRQLAFEEYGPIGDGGVGYSKITMIDVEANRFQGRPFYAESPYDEKTGAGGYFLAREMAQKKARAVLQELKISTETISHSVLVDHSVDIDNAQQLYMISTKELSVISAGDFEISLDSIPLDSLQCRNIPDIQSLGLRIIVFNQKTGKRKIIQQDTYLPKSRGCPFGYRIEKIYFYKGRLAIVLNVFVPGFEGGDAHYMIVTGQPL